MDKVYFCPLDAKGSLKGKKRVSGCLKRPDLLLKGFDLDLDADGFGHAGINQIVHAPFAAIERGGKIAAAGFDFFHRVLVAVEFVGFKGNGLGFSVHGQAAGDGADFFANEMEFIRNKADVRMFFGVENIGRQQVFGEMLGAGLQLVQRNGDVDGTAAFGGIEFHRAFKLVKTADIGAGAEVIDGKTGIGVVRVDLVIGGGGGRSGGGKQRAQNRFFHGVFLKLGCRKGGKPLQAA